MVYYIRFLKTPRIQKQKAGSITVSALICITTDLGDAFLADDVDLQVMLHLSPTKKVVYQEPLQWKAGRRELPVALGPFPAHVSQQVLTMGVTTTHSHHHDSHPLFSDSLLDERSIPLVMSGWSAEFGGPSLTAEKLVERRFSLTDKLGLSIWEETGNSIARHIWDAAIASVMYLQQIITGKQSAPALMRQTLLRTERSSSSSPLHVIELGSGCGIVGIALAQLLSRCSVFLTDLPEVEEIVSRNIAAAQPAPFSELQYRTLEWEDALPDDLCGGSIDLVLVSDCTYNADSLPALVSVLDRLVQMSPNAIILVALKRRHESEKIFFDLMQSAGLSTLHSHRMELPSQHDQCDQIELHCYGRAKKP
ncbi:hypothetical protein P175DRAFT_0478938 [Aspergillus ochraceoroseus IBT 24754]|uniref:Methyltransferase-domain-containing protein n=2 Tax=Aspergillus ochraceoroseus TaxID=138278 RepID=A0A2T5LWU1_9EURO|nr:uncharacterized protein P175DRAFT_0478938 [Aspergillus ochraceoroseus IBT 24754]KKK24980.1 hypothetical protein AOCH_003595 [Aspergillus ochraceoroseus]PTU20749.1 hypothetical protein P175DRAFT_0478938 [Aspergillus ochraceoroseus IBT 24754]